MKCYNKHCEDYNLSEENNCRYYTLVQICKKSILSSEKIQMTEEQAREMLEDCILGDSTWEEDIKRLKDKGYIKKSELEIAREQYEKYNSEVIVVDEKAQEMIRLANIYMMRLEDEIERLSK